MKKWRLMVRQEVAMRKIKTLPEARQAEEEEEVEVEEVEVEEVVGRRQLKTKSKSLDQSRRRERMQICSKKCSLVLARK